MSRWLTAALFAATVLSAQSDELTLADPQVEEASAIAREFISRMRPQLQAALTNRPPDEALAVCAAQAPAIALQLSRETGWSIKRVSLKPRNPAADPDAWERKQLEAFDRAVAADGEPGFAAAEIGGELRFMTPQRVGGPCLLCHGENVDPDTHAELQRLYPDDKAVGYQLGQVRGAISLTAPRIADN